MKVKIALISDQLTHDALVVEDGVRVQCVSPLNYKVVLRFFKPDFLFVESAWQGHKNRWKFKIASYDDHPKRNNHKLQKVVTYAKSLGIATVFWNKEDGVHFDRFIESAKLFEHIFTVDENCIPKYKAVVSKETTVHTLMFGVQSKFHHFSGFNFKHNRANFVGSYSHHVHNKRRFWQDLMFTSARSSRLGLDVYDRNSNRKSKNYRYPKFENLKTFPSVSYEKTAQVYKDYVISLNVNTIEDSPTMFSRRLLEILACGGIAVTNPSCSVDKLFSDYCYAPASQEEVEQLFKRIVDVGVSEEDRKRAHAGAMYVAKYHTWTHRLQEIQDVLDVK